MPLSRRELLAAPIALPFVCGAAAPKVPLGFSLYGMKSVALADALKACRTIGYDGVELALMPGYHADPKSLTVDDRKQLRTKLTDLGLALHGLMENLPEPAADATHKANLERLKAAAELAHSLAPNAPPPIETVLGGKPADWDKTKERLAERLGAWADVGKATKTVIAVKPHVANAMHTVEGATWLMKQIDSPWLRLAFDYSHFELRGVPLENARALLPYAAFVHVKDAKGKPDKFEFLLPGEGKADYSALAKILVTAKYPGSVVVEVSSQVSGKPGYDAVSAAKRSYAAVGPAFSHEPKK